MPEEGNPPITTGVKEHLLQYTTYEVAMPQASAEKKFLLRSTFLSFFLLLLILFTPFLLVLFSYASPAIWMTSEAMEPIPFFFELENRKG